MCAKLGAQDERLLVARILPKGERHRIHATISTASQPDAAKTEMLLPPHYDCCSAGAETSNWLLSLAHRETSEHGLLMDSGAAAVCLTARDGVNVLGEFQIAPRPADIDHISWTCG